MKKIVFVFTIVSFLSACSNKASEEKKEVTDASAPAQTEITNEMIENTATIDNPNQTTSAYAEITFKNTEHDFGDIFENQNVETVYEFTNTGKADLIISNCQAQCGCTVPNWPREPIAPGKSGKIKVAFNSAGRSGVNNKVVTVYANIPQNAVEIKFRANVKAISQ